MPVLVGHCHFLYDLLDVFVSGFYNAIHLQPVRRRVMMLDLEFLTELSDHNVVEVCTIICNDSLRNTIPTDKILFDELGHNILGDRSEGSCLNPICEVINGNQDEAVPIRSCRSNLPNHIDAPH